MNVDRYTLLKSLIILLSVFLPFFCEAQIPGFRNYTQEDGLNSTFGYRIKQDPKGFIWIGGDNGLFRFDGTEFRQFNEKPEFRNIDIIGCEPLASGEIFIIPFLNVSGYLKNNKLYTTEDNPELKKLQFGNNLPLLFSNDSLNRLFICAPSNPKSIYIYKNEKILEYPVLYDSLFSDGQMFCALYDFKNSEAYFMKSGVEIIAYNIHTKKKTSCNIRIESNTFSYGKDRFLVVKQNNTVVVYELTAPFVFKKINSFEVPEKIYQVFIDHTNRLWICLQEGGVLYFDQDLSDATASVKPLKFMEDYMINDLLKDRDGNVWFSTKNNGIFFLPDKLFKTYVHLPVKNNSSHLTAIAANKTAVFMGHNMSRGSMYHSRELTEFTLDKKDQFECRAVFANENVVIFGQTGTSYLLDLSSHNMVSLANIASVKNVIPYTAEKVLVCAGNTFYAYNFITRKQDTLLQERTYTALPYDANNLFVGTLKDLYKFNTTTKTKTLFLQGYYFNDLKKVSDHLYIGATKRNGVLLFDKNRVLREITENDGLASDQVKKIEVENEHTFWTATGLGLSRICLKGDSVAIQNFTRIDGLPSDRVSGCVIRKDTIYVATSKGLGIFPIKELLKQDKSVNKEVIINSINFGENERFDTDQSFTATYPDNTIIFNLSFLDYASQGKISYRYKTEGLNEDWQISNSSKIILNSLPPGKYTFKVYGLGYNGKQSARFTSYSFEIKPRFWQSALFYTLVTLLMAGTVMLLIMYFVKKRRDKKLKSLVYEKKIAELELQAIKAQINPHFIYNCLNSIQYMLYKKDYEKTENYLDRFSKMIRKTLLYSEKTFITIGEETDYLTFYLDMEKLRFKGNFNYTIHVAENVHQHWKIPSLLIQPFVENAIKHGIRKVKDRAGIIEIRFEYSGQQLSIIIRDNGSGLSDKSLLSKPSDSFGIKLSRKRVEAFRQLFDTDITIEINDLSEQGKQGTEIKLHLNLPHEH